MRLSECTVSIKGTAFQGPTTGSVQEVDLSSVSAASWQCLVSQNGHPLDKFESQDQNDDAPILTKDVNHA